MSPALVGGNESVQAFNAQGIERLWTITCVTISSLAVYDGSNEILAGNDDASVKAFAGESLRSRQPHRPRAPESRCIRLRLR